ncbi:putative flavonoid 3'-monooxygenase [Helianthus debilis subsp. tardiflorus]
MSRTYSPQEHILKQAQKELDIVVGQDRLVTERDLGQLTIIQAITKETFRLHPPSAIALPRIASESCEVDRYYIPKGSTLLFNLWAIARDPKFWTDPLEFKPTRFLPGGEKSNVDIRGNDFEVMPFGAGRRMCVGMSLGLRMTQLLIATLVQSFDWELANGLEPEKLNMDESYGLTLQKAEPLMVHPKPRLAPHVYQSV